MKSIKTISAIALIMFAPMAFAAKGGSCTPSLDQPAGLTASTDGVSVTADWTDVLGAEKYAIELVVQYDGAPEKTFSFTAFDADPLVVGTTSFSVPLSELANVVCNDYPDCTSTTTYDAVPASIRVKALNPPTAKGKDHAQCNPFAQVDVEVGLFCHAINAVNAFGGIHAVACPSGKTQFCDNVPIDPHSSDQAKLACETCGGTSCTNGTTYDTSASAWWFNGNPSAGYYGTGFIYGDGTPSPFAECTAVAPAGSISNWSSGCTDSSQGTWAPQ